MLHAAPRPPYPSLTPSADRLTAAVDQLIRFIAADSTSGREEPGVAIAMAIAGELGLPATRLAAAPGRDNVLIGHQKPAVLLCTHLDTVPPFIPARLQHDVVWGRGACDAKGVAIAMLHGLDLALGLLGPDTALACLLVVGEESDHIGAKAIAAEGRLTPRHILLGEPCGMAPAIGQKGLLKLRLSATGKSGHSAYPEVGSSAIHRLVDTLSAVVHARWPSDPSLGETTVNVGEISGGVAANVIAASASATVLFRCAAPVDAVLAALSDLLAATCPDIDATELSRSEPIDFDALGQDPGPAVPFNTDASYLLGLGARVSLLGPGDMRCAHSDNEHLSVADLRDGITRYAEAIVRLF
jgi:acetylornithine deacetylase